MTTIDIGVTGLSSLIQQSIPSTVLNRLAGANVSDEPTADEGRSRSVMPLKDGTVV